MAAGCRHILDGKKLKAEGGTTIAKKFCVIWQDKGCRLLLGLLFGFAAMLLICLTWGKHLVIVVDGRAMPLMQFRGTVADALARAGVTLGEADIAEPGPACRVLNKQIIRVYRVTDEKLVEPQLVSFRVERKIDRSLAPGRQKIVRYGSYGLAHHYIRVTYRDGLEVKRQTVSKRVIRQPQPMVVAYGPNYSVSRGSLPGGAVRAKFNPEKGSRVLTAVSTAYTHTGHRTATGIYPYEGVVSVDPRVIPLGTRLYVENYGYAVAADTGGSIKGNRVDVFFNTYQQAINWGRRTVKIHILD